MRVKKREEDALTTGEGTRSTVTPPGSPPPRSPSNYYSVLRVSEVGVTVEDLKQREGPARALAEVTTGHDDRAGSDRPTTGTPWQTVLDRWRKDVEDIFSPRTLPNYITRLQRTFRAIGKETFEDVDYIDLATYRDSWKEEFEDRWNRPLKKATLNGWISAVRSLYRFARKKLMLDVEDWGQRLDRPRKQVLEQERARHRPIPRDTFQAILEEAFRQEEYLWVVAARFAWQTLARIGDLYGLRWEDVSFSYGQVTIRAPKGAGPATKLLYPSLLVDLRELRDHHRAYLGLGWRGDPQGRPEDLVFRKDDGRTERNKRAAFREWFAYRLQKYARAVGYREHVFPHLLRSSAATDLSGRGASDRDIMDQGAWKTMASLQHYLRIDPEARRERLRAGLDI